MNSAFGRVRYGRAKLPLDIANRFVVLMGAPVVGEEHLQHARIKVVTNAEATEYDQNVFACRSRMRDQEFEQVIRMGHQLAWNKQQDRLGPTRHMVPVVPRVKSPTARMS